MRDRKSVYALLFARCNEDKYSSVFGVILRVSERVSAAREPHVHTHKHTHIYTYTYVYRYRQSNVLRVILRVNEGVSDLVS